MGRGPGSKGKTSKQAGVLGGAGANEPIDVSVETQPRHFTYVGKLDGSSEEGAKGQNPKSKGKGDVSRKVLWANQEDSVRRRVSFDGGRTSYLQNRVQQQYILI